MFWRCPSKRLRVTLIFSNTPLPREMSRRPRIRMWPVIASNSKLFAQDPFVQGMTRIVEKNEIRLVVHLDRDLDDVPHLEMIGDGGDRTLIRLENIDGHVSRVG